MPRDVVIRKPITVLLLGVVTIAIVAITVWMSGKSYANLDPIPFDEGGYERVEALRDIGRLVEPLAAAVAALPESVRRAIELRVLDQMEYASVAEQLGCTQGAARVRVSRGLKQLFDAVVPYADR